MSITIVAIGHKLPRWADEATSGYLKRLPADWQLTLKTPKAVDPDSGPLERVLQLEAERLAAAAPPRAKWIALDERGKDLTMHTLQSLLVAALCVSAAVGCNRFKPGPLAEFVPVAEVQNTVYSDDLHLRHRAVALLFRSEFADLDALLQEHFTLHRRGQMSANRLRRVTETIELANGVDWTPQLNAWVAHRPDSAWARKTRGFYLLERAWDARGGDVAHATPEARLVRARELAELARSDFSAALEKLPEASLAYGGLISVSLLTSDGADRKALFEAAWAVDRNINPVIRGYWVTLYPQWGGSEDAMSEFRNDLAARGATTRQLDELDSDFHRRRAQDEYRRGNRSGARAELRRAEGKLATPNVLKFIAELGRMDGDMAGVARAMERNLRENDPWDLWSMEALAQAYQALGHDEHARRMILRLQELHERYRLGI